MSIVDVKGNPLASNSAMASSNNYAPISHRGGPITMDQMLQPLAGNTHARADKLVTGHAYAKGGVQLHVDFIIGDHWRLQLKPDWRLLGVDPIVGRQWAKDIERRFHDWADDDRAFIDAEGKRTLTMMMRELVITHTRRNEGFVQSTWGRRQGTDNRTSFKLISPDRISNPNGTSNTESTKYGVQIGRFGRPLGYWARERHPSEVGAHNWRYIKQYLPWGRRQMLHLFEPWEDGQVRAVTDLIAALRRVELLDKFQDATLQNAIVNAFFAATIESEMDSEIMRQAVMGGGEGGNKDPLANYIDKSQQYHDGANIRMNETKVPHLLPNEKLTLHRASAPGGMAEYEASILRYLASDLGVSYEMLSRDYSKSNYSSARAGLAQAFIYFQGRRALVPNRASKMMLVNWLEEQVIEHGLALPPGITNFYKAQNALTKCKWLGTGKPNIDGLKEMKEATAKLELGISSLEDEMAALGKDYDEVQEQQMIEEADLLSRGITAPWMRENTKAIAQAPGVNTNE